MKLIDKSAVVAEIERRMKLRQDKYGKYSDVCDFVAFEELEYFHDEFLPTLEVKGVDLEKEVEDWVKTGPHTSYPWCTIPDAIRITAEHFFELGMQQSKNYNNNEK